MRFDFADPGTFAPVLEGADRVFLLEPQGPSGEAPDTFMVPFVEAAARGRRKIVLMTQSGVEADDGIPLRKVEIALERSGTPFVILRPMWFMDNFHTIWLQPIKEAGVMRLPAAGSRSTFIDSRDIAAVAAAALQTDRYDGQHFTLTGPEALDYYEAAAILSKAAGREIRYVPVDDDSFRISLIDAGLPAEYASYITDLFGPTREGAASVISPAVEDLTGRSPRTLEQYARDNASAWK